jgi:hypothetical protein
MQAGDHLGMVAASTNYLQPRLFPGLQGTEIRALTPCRRSKEREGLKYSRTAAAHSFFLCVKVKVTPQHTPCRYRSKAKVQLQSLRNLGVKRGWVVGATPRPHYPLERPRTHWLGGTRRQCGKPSPHRDAIPGPPSLQRVPIRNTLSQASLSVCFKAKQQYSLCDDQKAFL